MTKTGDEDTLPLPPAAAPARGGSEACLLLTVIFHPDSERIGARAWQTVRESGVCLQLGRGEPGFEGAGGGPVLGLEDRYISRHALTVRGGGDRWLLERPRGSSRCRVDGEELFTSLQVDGAAMRRGLRLLLGSGVLLLLRLAPKAEAEEPPAPAVDGLLGDSGYLRALRRQVLRLARSEGDVLLSGPTGTGKELLARALHEASPRRAGPLVSVNVAAIPAELAAAQLFGTARGGLHRRGAGPARLLRAGGRRHAVPRRDRRRPGLAAAAAPSRPRAARSPGRRRADPRDRPARGVRDRCAHRR